jgi:hypothetical protein
MGLPARQATHQLVRFAVAIFDRFGSKALHFQAGSRGEDNDEAANLGGL